MASLPDYLIGRRELLQRGEVKRREVHRFNLIDDLAVDLRFLRDLLPLRVLAEGGPVLLRGVAARMREIAILRALGATRHAATRFVATGTR